MERFIFSILFEYCRPSLNFFNLTFQGYFEMKILLTNENYRLRLFLTDPLLSFFGLNYEHLFQHCFSLQINKVK